MGALLGFTPFIGFAVIEQLFGILAGLITGAVVSIALLARDRSSGQRDINLLEAGSAVMFGALAIAAYAGLGGAWSIWQVRLWVDSGLVMIVAGSILAQRPFTLHHARERVSPEVATSARFLRTNKILSGVWGLAFIALAAVDLFMVAHPDTPVRPAVWSSLAALTAAAWFTKSYTGRLRRTVGTDMA